MTVRRKKNFKVDNEQMWAASVAKCEKMRREGFDVDMTVILNRAVADFEGESITGTAERLGLVQGDPILHPWRGPGPRPAATR